MTNIDCRSTLIIVADDLTGAADCAARGFGAGLHSEIHPSPTPVNASPVQLIATSTDSRHLQPEEAAAAMRHTIKQYGSMYQSATWYNKIDSTLRGNIGAEVDAMLATLQDSGVPAFLVICPAFPAQGRWLVDGLLVRADRMAQKDAEKTVDKSLTGSLAAHSTPPESPAQSANLVDILASQSQNPVLHIPLLQVRRGASHLQQEIRNAVDAGARLLVVDGKTESDLQTIVEAAQTMPGAVLCGSAGLVAPLAQNLAQQSGMNATGTKADAANARLPIGPIWAIVGSGSRTARRQILAAQEAGIHCYNVVESKPEWSSEQSLILHLPEPGQDVVLEGNAARRYGRQLVHALDVGLQVQTPAALIVVGGDTAQQILDRFNIEQMEVLAEIQPGMPLIRNAQQADMGPYVVLKAGNHGTSSALVELIAWLKARQSDIPKSCC